MDDTDELKYVPNPKHADPTQRGRKGSPCPKDLSKTREDLLKSSKRVGKKRYNTCDNRVFCAQYDNAGGWHGYPIDIHEAPPKLVKEWISEGKLDKQKARKQEKRYRRNRK